MDRKNLEAMTHKELVDLLILSERVYIHYTNWNSDWGICRTHGCDCCADYLKLEELEPHEVALLKKLDGTPE